MGSVVALDPVVLKILTHGDWGCVRMARCSLSFIITSNFSPTPHQRVWLFAEHWRELFGLPASHEVFSAISPEVAHLSAHPKVLFP